GAGGLRGSGGPDRHGSDPTPAVLVGPGLRLARPGSRAPVSRLSGPGPVSEPVGRSAGAATGSLRLTGRRRTARGQECMSHTPGVQYVCRPLDFRRPVSHLDQALDDLWIIVISMPPRASRPTSAPGREPGGKTGT